jgi:hypothetical protein|tara:strand:- start:399 stop:605 length:207 start_codon:yes stop_codon:yes gene_type:complete
MKNLIIASIIVLFSTSVFAGSCPMMAKQVDDKIKQAQELRDNAMAAHDSGDHSKSEELLNEALELFKS